MTFFVIQWYLDRNTIDKIGNISKSTTTVARISMLLWSGTFMISLTFPLILARGFDKARAGLLNNKSMLWPDHFWKILLGLYMLIYWLMCFKDPF